MPLIARGMEPSPCRLRALHSAVVADMGARARDMRREALLDRLKLTLHPPPAAQSATLRRSRNPQHSSRRGMGGDHALWQRHAKRLHRTLHLGREALGLKGEVRPV